ncbi:hypothetical protein F4774DRAFT_370817 [Daldinia eschscholtzii]|nr:hypothetical protein F4774DRAFT_370817 [Daldinia eschscholtzii]
MELDAGFCSCLLVISLSLPKIPCLLHNRVTYSTIPRLQQGVPLLSSVHLLHQRHAGVSSWWNDVNAVLYKIPHQVCRFKSMIRHEF